MTVIYWHLEQEWWGAEMAKMIVETWLDTKFEGGRHQKRVDMIMEEEQ